MNIREEAPADADAIAEVTRAHEGIPQEFFLALPFNGYVPQGRVTFHPAFQVTA